MLRYYPKHLHPKLPFSIKNQCKTQGNDWHIYKYHPQKFNTKKLIKNTRTYTKSRFYIEMIFLTRPSDKLDFNSETPRSWNSTDPSAWLLGFQWFQWWGSWHLPCPYWTYFLILTLHQNENSLCWLQEEIPAHLKHDEIFHGLIKILKGQIFGKSPLRSEMFFILQLFNLTFLSMYFLMTISLM